MLLLFLMILLNISRRKKSPKTGYRIRVWNETYLDTNYKPNRNISISKYEATYPIKYYDVTKTIKVTCNVLYTIRGRYSKSGNFSSEKSSSINYLECKNISLGELIQYKYFLLQLKLYHLIPLFKSLIYLT